MSLPLNQVHITADNLGPLVNICAISFLVPTIFSIIGRLFTKLTAIYRLTLDDFTICVALVSLRKCLTSNDSSYL